MERNLGTGIARGRKFSILRDSWVGIADRGLAFEHFLDTLGCNIGTRQHDREHADHEEAHDDNHRVGDERDEVACLERARVDGMAAEPHDADRHEVHDEHHERHHERHDAIREQLRFHQARTRLIEALLLMLLAVERPHDRKAHEHLARHKVHAVDELLHDLELRHGDLDEHHEDERNREHGDDDDPAHREVGARDHDDAADCEDGRVEDHAQQHHGDHLDLLDIVGPTRNQRRRAKRLNFGVGEGDDLVEKPPAQGSSHLRRSSRREETDCDCHDHAERGEHEHLGARGEEIVHLHGIHVDAELLVFRPRRGNTLLRDERVRHVAHRLARLIEHGGHVIFAHKPGIKRHFHLIKIKVGNLVGIVDDGERKRHRLVEVLSLLIARLGEGIIPACSLVVRLGEELLVGFGQHHLHEVVGALGKLRCGRVLHARLLDSHVDNVGGVSRKRQVAECLHS